MVLIRAVIVAAVVAAVRPVAADDGRRDADQHARRGVAQYKLGHYADAIAEFEQAYVLYPSDTLLYDLGQAHRQLDHCREALDYYHRFLDDAPDSPLAAKVSELIPPLDHACAIKFEKPVELASTPAPTVPAAEPSVAQTAPPPAPAASDELVRVRASFGAGVITTGGATATPVGATLIATHPIRDGNYELGGEVAGAWFGGDPGTTSSMITVRALASARIVQTDQLELRVGAGLGAVVLSNVSRELVNDPRMAGGTITMPDLALAGMVDRAIGGGWSASLGAEVGLAASSALRGPVAESAQLSVAIGYRR